LRHVDELDYVVAFEMLEEVQEEIGDDHGADDAMAVSLVLELWHTSVTGVFFSGLFLLLFISIGLDQASLFLL